MGRIPEALERDSVVGFGRCPADIGGEIEDWVLSLSVGVSTEFYWVGLT